ncbi:hypothetical protein HK097_009848 [Rhizophlyctis rosea]|uniref:Uncharacterized protein n=1 Tax=Rhizophlyctis rosea TaxID=64517 RepID=A0AAD5X7K7_9FUNG|nr:hypothetical protein HK097_009848 [Rhizophlyctis rosea]
MLLTISPSLPTMLPFQSSTPHQPPTKQPTTTPTTLTPFTLLRTLLHLSSTLKSQTAQIPQPQPTPKPNFPTRKSSLTSLPAQILHETLIHAIKYQNPSLQTLLPILLPKSGYEEREVEEAVRVAESVGDDVTVGFLRGKVSCGKGREGKEEGRRMSWEGEKKVVDWLGCLEGGVDSAVMKESDTTEPIQRITLPISDTSSESSVPLAPHPLSASPPSIFSDAFTPLDILMPPTEEEDDERESSNWEDGEVPDSSECESLSVLKSPVSSVGGLLLVVGSGEVSGVEEEDDGFFIL